MTIAELRERAKERLDSLPADRLSDHRCMANLFRLYLHTLAVNLLAQLRSVVADPPAPAHPSELPAEALAGKDRFWRPSSTRWLWLCSTPTGHVIHDPRLAVPLIASRTFPAGGR